MSQSVEICELKLDSIEIPDEVVIHAPVASGSSEGGKKSRKRRLPSPVVVKEVSTAIIMKLSLKLFLICMH